MGRGRAKAKQTKVARRLKYYSPDTDLTALERELRADSVDGADDDVAATDESFDVPDEEDDYGAWSSDQR